MERILLQVRVTKDMKAKLKDEAKKNGLSLNSLIVMLFKNYLEKEGR